MVVYIVASIVSVFLDFRRTVGPIRKFFSLKPLASQGKSSLKVSAPEDPVVSEKLGNKQTHRLSDTLLLYRIDFGN